MLQAINQEIAESEANVEAQYLRTLDDTGYVVTDVAADRTDGFAIEARLRALQGTLRSRVLF